MDFGSFAFDPVAITGLLAGAWALGFIAGGVAALVMSVTGRARGL